MKKFIVAFSLCISLIMPAPSHAFLGFGDIVFDPGAFVQFLIDTIKDTGFDIKQVYSEVETSIAQHKADLMRIKAAIDDAEKLMRLGMTIKRLTEANDIAGLAKLAQDYSLTLQELDMAKWLALNWDDFTVNEFMKVIDILTEGDAIGIFASDVEDMFSNKYEGWEAYAEQTYNTADFGEKYNEWSTINRDTLKGALKTIGIQAEGIHDEQDLLVKLKEKAATAEGSMQINQVAVEMASVGIGQMQDLKMLMMSQNQMHAAFYASQQDEKDLLNAQAQSHNMREYEDGIVPVTDDATWNDNGFKFEVH